MTKNKSNDLKDIMKEIIFKNELNFLLVDSPIISSKKSLASKNLTNFSCKSVSISKSEKIFDMQENKSFFASTDNERNIIENTEENSDNKSKYFYNHEHERCSKSINKSKFKDLAEAEKLTLLKEDKTLYQNNYLKSSSNDTVNNSNNFENFDLGNISMINSDCPETELIYLDSSLRSPDINSKRINSKNSEFIKKHNLCLSTLSSNTDNNTQKNRFDNLTMNSSIKETDIFPNRIKKCLIMVEDYLTKYKNFQDKLFQEVVLYQNPYNYGKNNLNKIF